MHSVSVIAACLWMAFLLPIPVHADQSFFPLGPGYTWEYVSGPEYQGVITLTGTREVAGYTVTVRRVMFTDNNGLQEFENYWSVAPDGTVLLHGFTDNEGYSLAYNPPLPYLLPDAQVGSLWTSVFRAYENLDASGNPLWDGTIDFHIPSGGPLTVPAGTFESIRLEYRPMIPEAASQQGRNYSISGSPTASLARSQLTAAEDWGSYTGDYARGVGEIRFAGASYFELSSYDFGVPTLVTTWARLKAQCRLSLP